MNKDEYIKYRNQCQCERSECLNRWFKTSTGYIWRIFRCADGRIPCCPLSISSNSALIETSVHRCPRQASPALHQDFVRRVSSISDVLRPPPVNDSGRSPAKPGSDRPVGPTGDLCRSPDAATSSTRRLKDERTAPCKFLFYCARHGWD